MITLNKIETTINLKEYHHLILNMRVINDNISSLSRMQVKIIANLEFKQTHYFTREDITPFFENKKQVSNTIHRLIAKKRVIKLNRNKYYLVPIKAKTGKWTDTPFRIANEMLNGKDYYIGGWTAANYWGLTDQIPMKIEIFTNKRNGVKNILSTTFIFKKTTQKRINQAITKKESNYSFKIIGKKEAKKWLKSKNY